MDKPSPQQAREFIHEQVREMIEIDPPEGWGDADSAPGMVRSWVLIATIRYSDDSNQMYLLAGDALGQPLTQWDRDGLLHYGLYDFSVANSDS